MRGFYHLNFNSYFPLTPFFAKLAYTLHQDNAQHIQCGNECPWCIKDCYILVLKKRRFNF